MDILSFFGLTKSHLSQENIISLVRIAILLVIGLPLVHFLGKVVRRFFSRRLSVQPGMVAGKIVYYVGIFIILFSTLNELGFNLNTLLGAAGIVGIAVGFASQTSVSNIISGIFLMLEQPFVVNDFITIDSVSGQVLSVDLLSVKLKTDDNRFIRIPNEHIIKTKLTNVTRFPVRRVDIRVEIAFTEHIPRVRELLMQAAKKNEYCLEEPAPQTLLEGFGPSSVGLLLTAWATQKNWQTLKDALLEEINQRFNEEGVHIPLRRIALYPGSDTEPFPVQIVEPEPHQGGAR